MPRYSVHYETPHKYRGGRVKSREETKKVEIPDSAFRITWDDVPKARTNRQGNEVYGVEVVYSKKVGLRGGGTDVKTFSKIVELPKEARNVFVTQEKGLGIWR